VAGALIVLFMVPRVRTAVLNRILYTFTGVEATSNVGQTVQSLRTRENVTLEGSANARVLAWKRIFTVHFPRHPILGSGVTRVGLVDTQIPLVVGETGLVGLALFLWMLLRVAKMGWIVYRRSGDPLGRSVGLGLLAALVGLLFHSSGANTFIIVRVIEPFWFLAALCARLYDGIEKAWDSPLPLS